MNDPYRLGRIVEAQNSGGSYLGALAEMQLGRKESHWIWYVFPQMAGLASSHTSREFAISSLEEAELYLRHPVLGPRLVEITTVVNSHVDKSAADIFGPDDVKFHSSMTRTQIGSCSARPSVSFFTTRPMPKLSKFSPKCDRRHRADARDLQPRTSDHLRPNESPSMPSV